MKERSGMPYDVVAYESDDIAMQLNETEEGLFHRMLRRSWMNGSIPADLVLLAPICRTHIHRLRKAWKRLSQLWIQHPDLPGRLINLKQERERTWVVGKSETSRQAANERWKPKKEKEEADANALRTLSDGNTSPPHPLPKGNTEGKGNPPTPQTPAANHEGKQVGLETKIERPKDEAYEVFVTMHNDQFQPAVYHRDQKADFVRLSSLRKDHKLGARESPPKWDVACRNYLASSRRKYSVADLASNYTLFVHGQVDRFGKLINAPNAKVHGVPIFQGGGRTMDDFDDDGNLRKV